MEKKVLSEKDITFCNRI